MTDTSSPSFYPIRDRVFVTDIEAGLSRRASGLIEVDDNMQMWGIKARWCKVYKIGPDVTDLKVGDWLLVQHGRWTNRIKLKDGDTDLSVWRVEYPAGILLISDNDPRQRQNIAAPGLIGYSSGS